MEHKSETVTQDHLVRVTRRERREDGNTSLLLRVSIDFFLTLGAHRTRQRREKRKTLVGL